MQVKGGSIAARRVGVEAIREFQWLIHDRELKLDSWCTLVFMVHFKSPHVAGCLIWAHHLHKNIVETTITSTSKVRWSNISWLSQNRNQKITYHEDSLQYHINNRWLYTTTWCYQYGTSSHVKYEIHSWKFQRNIHKLCHSKKISFLVGNLNEIHIPKQVCTIRGLLYKTNILTSSWKSFPILSNWHVIRPLEYILSEGGGAIGLTRACEVGCNGLSLTCCSCWGSTTFNVGLVSSMGWATRPVTVICKMQISLTV